MDRVGPYLVIAAAGVTLFAGGELASHTDPNDSVGVLAGLFLIGLGWSFGLIAGSALLSASFAPTDRVAQSPTDPGISRSESDFAPCVTCIQVVSKYIYVISSDIWI